MLNQQFISQRFLLTGTMGLLYIFYNHNIPLLDIQMKKGIAVCMRQFLFFNQ